MVKTETNTNKTNLNIAKTAQTKTRDNNRYVTKTGNGERGTGNGERGTGNGERGTSVQR